MMAFAVAFAIWTVEKLFDIHLLEVKDHVQKSNPHTFRWYHEKIKR